MDEWTLKFDPTKVETEQQHKRIEVGLTLHKHSAASLASYYVSEILEKLSDV